VYDLEDSVPLDRKGAARQKVFDALQAGKQNERCELAVRVNAVGSGFELDDLTVTACLLAQW
jgi:citrate lyase subunit beta-like protein